MVSGRGVVVHADYALNGVENNLERILQRHIPSRLRDEFVFHATEIFNGGKTLKREKDNLVGPREWPIERRLAIAEEIMELDKIQIANCYRFYRASCLSPRFEPSEGFSRERANACGACSNVHELRDDG